MSTTLKNTTLALLTTFNLAACGWTIEPIGDDSSSTNNSGMDSGMDDPTGTLLMSMHFSCYNDSNYQVNAGGYPVRFDLMHTCVEIEGSEWESAENMTKILDGCTKACQESAGGWQNHCENEGWKSVDPTGTPCDPYTYKAEYGGDILWFDGVQSVDRQVKCDLRTTCGDMFGESVADLLQSGNVLEDERPSGAKNHRDLELRIDYGNNHPLDLAGAIEYTTSQCGEPACPFYLGDFEVLQGAADWHMVLDLGEFGRIDKQIKYTGIRLVKPALGISLQDGQVAFPAETLMFRIDVEVAGPAHPLLENGSQSFLLRNPIPVLGRLNAGTFILGMDVPTGFGSARISTVRSE